MGVSFGPGQHLWKATTMRGRLITIEGLDGAGKTTLADALVPALAARGADVELLREPGGVELSERIRTLVKDPALRVDPRAEALLYAAARAQLCAERVAPLLDAGRWVLLDRFVDSSLAYQGAGRGLGVEAVRAINDFGTGGLVPDRTLLLRVDTATRDARRQPSRGEAPDRLEREDGAFFAAIGAAYDDLAAADPARIRVLDARGAARRGARGGARGGRGPPTIGGVTRRILAAVRLVAGLALPSAAAAQQTTQHGHRRPDHRSGGRRQTTDRAAGGQTTTRPPGADDDPAGDGAGGDGSGRHAARDARPRRPRRRRPPPDGDRTATQPAATRGNDRAAVLLLLLVACARAVAARAVALARWQAWDPPWLARWRHATGEAGWRAGNAWAEFTDWLRLGR